MRFFMMLAATIILATAFGSGEPRRQQVDTQTGMTAYPVRAQELEPQVIEQQAIVVIDVRTPDEYAKDHYPGAINMPLQGLSDSISTLQQYDKIVVVCSTGKRARQAYSSLIRNGLTNVYNGGKWQKLPA